MLQQELNKIWGTWKIDKQLGEGSFGKVYRIEKKDAKERATVNRPQAENLEENQNQVLHLPYNLPKHYIYVGLQVDA